MSCLVYRVFAPGAAGGLALRPLVRSPFIISWFSGTIFVSGAKAMPVQRSRACLAAMLNVMRSVTAFSDHVARYVQPSPSQPGGVDHEPDVGGGPAPTDRQTHWKTQPRKHNLPSQTKVTTTTATNNNNNQQHTTHNVQHTTYYYYYYYYYVLLLPF